MYIVSHYFVGIVTLHIFAAYWYVTGTLIRSSRELRNDAAALVDIVITIATGMAMFGFAVFAIGIIGFLDVRGFQLIAIVEIAAFALMMRRSKLNAVDFWSSRFKPLRHAFTPGAGAVYGVLLLLAIPAALPAGAFDVMEYYLPYSLDWASAGRIYVDTTLPIAYYANNFLLFFATYFRLGLGEYTNFLPWFCGALSALGIFGMVRGVALSRTATGSAPWLTLGIPLAVTASFAFEPSFLRWVNTGMLDVPLGLFIFFPVMATASMLLDRGTDYRREFIVMAAFVVGMKPSMLAYLPLFASLLIVSYPMAESKRRLIAPLLLLVLLSSPWYVMNFILDGDPVPPVLHLALHRPDPQFTVSEAMQMRQGFSTSSAPQDLIALPIRFFWDALGSGFAEYGASFAVTFIYVPFLAAGYAFVRRRASGMPVVTVLLTASFVYGFASWVAISYHARFFLEIMPIYFTALGAIVLWFVQRRSALVQLTALTVLVLGVVPSPSAWGFLNWLYTVNYSGINAYAPDRAFFNDNWCDGCDEADYVADHLPSGHKVFTLSLSNTTYLLRERGIINVGDRFSSITPDDLYAAVEHNDLSGFVRRLSIGAFLLNTKWDWPDDRYSLFLREVRALGFHPYEYPHPRKDGHIIIFIR